MCVAGRHAWQGACVVGRIGGVGHASRWGVYVHGRKDGHCSRRYASYWNAFLFKLWAIFFIKFVDNFCEKLDWAVWPGKLLCVARKMGFNINLLPRAACRSAGRFHCSQWAHRRTLSAWADAAWTPGSSDTPAAETGRQHDSTGLRISWWHLKSSIKVFHNISTIQEC